MGKEISNGIRAIFYMPGTGVRLNFDARPSIEQMGPKLISEILENDGRHCEASTLVIENWKEIPPILNKALECLSFLLEYGDHEQGYEVEVYVPDMIDYVMEQGQELFKKFLERPLSLKKYDGLDRSEIIKNFKMSLDISEIDYDTEFTTFHKEKCEEFKQWLKK